jgi:hypothetical protein
MLYPGGPTLWLEVAMSVTDCPEIRDPSVAWRLIDHACVGVGLGVFVGVGAGDLVGVGAGDLVGVGAGDLDGVGAEVGRGVGVDPLGVGVASRGVGSLDLSGFGVAVGSGPGVSIGVAVSTGIAGDGVTMTVGFPSAGVLEALVASVVFAGITVALPTGGMVGTPVGPPNKPDAP